MRNLVGLVGAALLVALAFGVFAKAPGRTLNQRLALVLGMLASVIVSGAGGAAPVVTSPSARYGLYSLHLAVEAAMPWLYLVFIGRALDSSVARFLRRPRVELGLWTLAVATAAAEVVLMGWLHDPAWYLLPGDPAPVRHPPIAAHFVYATVGYAVTLLIALHALWRAPDAAARRRMWAYVAAFGVLDVSWGLAYLSLPFFFLGQPLAAEGWGVFAWFHVGGPVVFALLLSYAILRTQLFDIDLKIKWTISKGTVAAAFLAVFLMATEGAQLVAGGRNPWFGVAAAGLLVFALAPLQRLAERVSDRAMPRVRDTDEYRLVRKREVYRAALEEAVADGGLSEKDRNVLAALADGLGLTNKDARAVEREVVQP